MSVQWDRDYRRELPTRSQVKCAFTLALIFAGLIALVCLVNEFIPVGK